MRRPGAVVLLIATAVIAGAAPAAASPAAGASAHAATGLSRDERKVVAAVDKNAAAAQALLERAVAQNSGSLNFEGVRAVGRMFQAELDALGFQTTWIEGAAWRRAGHLVAHRVKEVKTPVGPRILLIGHIDTVFPADSPFQRFERFDATQARGPGILDMKGGDVIMLLALRALQDAGLLDRIPLTVVLIGDEEDSGSPLDRARKDLVEAARWADIAIGFEDGDGNPHSAVIARRGSSGWRLATEGTPAHSSQVWTESIGSGAVYEAARILAAFDSELKGEPLLTVNPGVVVGGTSLTLDTDQSRGTAFGKNNVVAARAEVQGDLRSITLDQRTRAMDRMRAIVARHLPGTSATITFDEGYPPLAPSDGNRRLLALYDGASRDLGTGDVHEVNPADAGAADVSFTEGLVDMALDGIGMRGQGGHTDKETADLSSLPTQAKRAAVTLVRLAAGDAAKH
jgi:glutamate carboxypeptidase